METKTCSCCGKELPVTEFNSIKKKSGEVKQLTVCKECMRIKQSEGHAARKAQRENKMQEEVQEARNLRLHEFSPRELMEELHRRGYEGKLRYVQVHEIDLSSF